MRKLVKPWNKLPAGASVTTDPADQVVLVDQDRLAFLEKEGHLAPPALPAPSEPGAGSREGAREIPTEVKTGGTWGEDPELQRSEDEPPYDPNRWRGRPVKKEP